MENKPEAPTLGLSGLTQSADGINLIGLQGEPNSGKTTAALTAPNPIVLDFDHKLPPGIQSVPFWSDEWIYEYMKMKPPLFVPRRDALTKWLRENILKIPASHTLIVDSWTAIHNAFDLHASKNQMEYWSAAKEYDGYKMFRHKILYSLEVLSLLKSAACTVIVTFHEQAARDEKGKLTARYRPLMEGNFRDQLCGHFGNMFRQVCKGKDDYRWQVKSNNLFTGVQSPIYKFPPDVTEIKADWNELQKYKIK